MSKESKQVMIASAMTPIDVNGILSLLETTDNVPDSCREPDRKGEDTTKVIIIPTECCQKLPIVSWAVLICQHKFSSGYGGRIDM